MSRSNPIQVQRYLAGVEYPVTKRRLVEKARENGAGEDVLAALERLPERDLTGPGTVSTEVSGA